MSKKTDPTIHVALDGTDLPPLELKRVVGLRMTKRVIYLEEMDGGGWRLSYSESVIPDLKKLQALRIVRGDQP